MAQPAVQPVFVSPEDYFAREEAAEYKSEYHNGEIFAMAGGSRNHSVICCNVIRRIGEAINDNDCIPFDSNMKLYIKARNLFVYPDAMVVCGSIAFYRKRTDCITNPVLVIEVLSPSTETFDRMKKMRFYRTVPSVQEYVLISQDEPLVEVYSRQDEKSWLYRTAEGLDAAIRWHSIHYDVALRDVYHKVEWPQEPGKA